MTDRDKKFLQITLFYIAFITLLMLGALFSINYSINNQLKTIVKLEKRQNAKTPETTTPELVIEENTLWR